MATRTASAAPVRKVIVGGLAGALSTVLLWVLNTYVLPKPMPAEVGSAVTTVLSFVVSYLVPPAASDQTVEG